MICYLLLVFVISTFFMNLKLLEITQFDTTHRPTIAANI